MKRVPPVIQCLRKLNAFKPVRRALGNAKITASNWPDLQTTLQNNWNLSIETTLTDLYNELCLYGRKSIVLFDIPEDLRKRLLLNTKQASELQSVPIPIIPEPTENSSPELVSILDNSEERLFVFWSCRHLRHEEKIDIRSLGASLPETLRGLDELWGYKYDREPAIDIVSIPRRPGRAQVRVHLPSQNRMYPTEEDVREHLLRAMGQFAGRAPSLGQQVNVFPAIASIYQNATEGRIVGLTFWRPSQARCHDFLPSKTQGDLRNEAYHRAGVEAIGHAIDIYSLQVQWDETSDETTLVDARINFDGSPLNREQQTLSVISIPCPVGKNEFDHIFQRLEHYV